MSGIIFRKKKDSDLWGDNCPSSFLIPMVYYEQLANTSEGKCEVTENVHFST